MKRRRSSVDSSPAAPQTLAAATPPPPPPPAVVDDEKQQSKLTDYEARLYDRSIRLWGVAAQQRLRASKILLLGFDGLNAEVAKNLILAGVHSVTIVDNDKTSLSDLCSNFFLSLDDLGKKRALSAQSKAQLLSSVAKVDVIDEDPACFDASFCKSYDVIQCSDICRENMIPFYFANCYGIFGFCFHSPFHTKDDQRTSKVHASKRRKIEPKLEVAESHCQCYSLSQAISVGLKDVKPSWSSRAYLALQVLCEYSLEKSVRLEMREGGFEEFCELYFAKIKKEEISGDFYDKKFLRMLFNNLEVQFSPTFSVVGGVIAQEIVKTLSPENASIIDKWFFYHGIEGEGLIENFSSK